MDPSIITHRVGMVTYGVTLHATGSRRFEAHRGVAVAWTRPHQVEPEEGRRILVCAGNSSRLFTRRVFWRNEQLFGEISGTSVTGRTAWLMRRVHRDLYFPHEILRKFWHSAQGCGRKVWRSDGRMRRTQVRVGGMIRLFDRIGSQSEKSAFHRTFRLLVLTAQ